VLIGILEVIWIYDQFIRPPGPKMQVCVDPANGFFFRINERPKWQIPVQILQADNPFLTKDSYLECGSPLELDDYVIQQSLARTNGPIGVLNRMHLPDICKAIHRSNQIRKIDLAHISAALGCP
jgi:hypothetical protein